MSHHCSAVIIHCMDFRIQGAINEWLIGQGLIGDCDRISFAGAAKDIVEGKEAVLSGIDVASRLHNVRRVILMHHTDCGAYGGRMEDDEVKHRAAMTQAREIIQRRWPEMQVDDFLLDIALDGTMNIK